MEVQEGCRAEREGVQEGCRAEREWVRLLEEEEEGWSVGLHGGRGLIWEVVKWCEDGSKREGLHC